jgi:glycolate oxidase FAD binding subunit
MPQAFTNRSRGELSGVQELGSLGVQVKSVEKPTKESEAQQILARAFREKLTVLPCGGGTNLGVGVLPESVDIVLDMTGMNRVLAFDSRNLNLAVLSGMSLDQINEFLAGKEKGFFLPLDPPLAHRATIGGVYAANSSGPLRLRYGTIRDQVLGVRGADAQGREVGFGGKTVKNVSGYDLTKFFIGSAGSLGLITSISLRVHPLPDASSLCDLVFNTLEELEKFLGAFRSSVMVPSAVAVTELAGGPGVSDTAGSRFRVMIGFEGHSQAVDRQNRDALKMAGEWGGLGEARMGRTALMQTLRLAIDPEEWSQDLLALKISVPIAQGPRTFVSLAKLARTYGFQSKGILFAGNGVITLFVKDSDPKSAARLMKEVKDVGQTANGYAIPLRAHRTLLQGWGSRVEPALHQAVLKPLKEKLDPTGVFPPMI